MYAALVNAFERFRVPKNAVCATVAKAFGERLPALIRDKNGREISTVVAAPRDIKKFLALCPDRLDLAAQLAACVPQPAPLVCPSSTWSPRQKNCGPGACS